MLDTPQLAHHCAQPAAVIRLTVPRTHIQTVMGPAMAELMATLASQGIAPAGPMFSRHFRIDPRFSTSPSAFPSLPRSPLAAGFSLGSCRRHRAAAVVPRHGPYEGAWERPGKPLRPGRWRRQRPAARPRLWECYLSGPESSPDPATWATELNQPVAA